MLAHAASLTRACLPRSRSSGVTVGSGLSRIRSRNQARPAPPREAPAALQNTCRRKIFEIGGGGGNRTPLLIQQWNALVVLRRRNRLQIGVDVGEVCVREHCFLIWRHRAVAVANED